MGSHDGRVDHEVLVVGVVCEDLEYLFPDSRLRPASETLVDALPVAVAFGHMAPVRSATQNPQHSIDERAII